MPIGAALLPYIDQITFKVAVGVLLTLWSPAMLLARELPRISGGGKLADAAAGLVGGAMGGLGGLTGPAPILWCTLRGWDRDIQRAVFQSFNISMHMLTMTIYLGLGLIGGEALRDFALIAPALLIPTLIGARLYRLPEGGLVIDTPGVRSVALGGTGPAEVASVFPEIQDAPPCRFTSCTHRMEPGCSVLAGVQTGAIPENVYARYRKLLLEVLVP